MAQDDDDALPPPKGGTGSLSLGVTLLGLVVALYLLFDVRRDVAFWFSSPPTIDLGQEGDYHLDRLDNGVVARIHGRPGKTAVRFSRLAVKYELVGVEGTNILVRRETPGVDLPKLPGAKEPPPDPAPFESKGRLLRDTSIQEYAFAFTTFVQRGDVELSGDHLYVLLNGDLPYSGWKTPAALLALLGMAGLNIYTLARYLRLSRERLEEELY